MNAANMPPLDCEAVVRELWDWLDDELPADRWTAIQDHLASCTGCSEHVAFARTFLTKVTTPPSSEPDVQALKYRVRMAIRGRSH